MSMFRLMLEELVNSSSSEESGDDIEVIFDEIERNSRRRKRRLAEDLKLIDKTSKKRKIPKVVEYFAEVRQYQPDVFQSHFRLHREALGKFLKVLEPKYASVVQNQHGGREGVDLEKRLLMTLWTLANIDTFREISDRFGVSNSTTHKILFQMCNMIAEEENRFIKWPTRYSSEAEKFKSLRSRSFPGVIGAVDGMDISIPAPIEDKTSYYNPTGGFSLKMQGICDSTRKFTNVFIGFPGASHDASMWRASPIYERLKNDANLGEEFHLVGDLAYPLDIFLMKPYRDNGHLSMNQKLFNRTLNSHRIVIEQAFAQLKGQYRRLKRLNMLKIEQIPKIVMACCVLYNFSLEEGIEADEISGEEESVAIQENYNEETNSRAQNKRNAICNMLN